MPILPEYSLAGRRAVLYTAGGDDAPYLGQVLAEAGASVTVLSRRPGPVSAYLASLLSRVPITWLTPRGVDTSVTMRR